MTTLGEVAKREKGTRSPRRPIERRGQRRHDLELQGVAVERFAGKKRPGLMLGKLIDLSSGGMRIRTAQPDVRPDQQIRVRLELPAYAGICPFVDTSGPSLRGKGEWVGWMAVTRVQAAGNGQYDVAGRLVDMDDLDRGMLSLYLSTQPVQA